MHVAAISLAMFVVVGEAFSDALLDRAAAEIGRISSFDAWYSSELRILIPFPPQEPPTGKGKEPPTGKGSFAEQARQFSERIYNTELLDGRDERALRKRAQIRFIRRAEDFLITFEDQGFRGNAADSIY